MNNIELKLYKKTTDGLPDMRRPFVVYNKNIKGYEIFQRIERDQWTGHSDSSQRISPDGEFYSGANGWIYPINFDSYCYLDELGLNN